MPYPTWLDFGGFGKGEGSGKMSSSQSGKSTLLAAISCRLKELGYLVVLTALNEAMVDAANNKLKDERAAANDFYDDEMCEQITKNRAQGVKRNAMGKISSNIVKLTSGELVQRISIRTVKQWLKAVHSKRLQSHIVFNNTDSLLTVFVYAITFMDPHPFLSPKSLNSNGQPSDYSIQLQFFRGLLIKTEYSPST
ncbi:hypothetical protein SELMODRAFT_429415 [Selaginella moellendorffii]|uniref:Uncharacterized protein n=1 Tax=Selaginella moellendorffii TaxID=88036 RepID=D8T638_SELML|nr:hypothetical protein SELMODRAFT_429415 [Selaginella moellendorffii]